MAIGARRNATPAPGNGGLFSTVLVDPTSARAVKFVEALAGLSELGIRFPYNNGSTIDLTVSGTTQITDTVNYYDEVTVEGTGTLEIRASPCFIFCHSFKIETGGRVDADGQGGAGGVGGAGVDNEDGEAGADGEQGDGGASSLTDPPQYPYGISTGGGGGGGGSTVVSANKSGGAGGDSGRASAVHPGAAGAPTTPPSDSDRVGADGEAGTTVHTIDLLDRILSYAVNEYNGGSGGGGGGGGGNADAGGGDGGNGGAGGGVLFIVTEQWDNDGAVTADGEDGTAGAEDVVGGEGAGGGGGGGAGGVICVMTASALTEGTFQANGGAGGAGGDDTTSGTNADGGAGGAGANGVTLLLKVGTG